MDFWNYPSQYFLNYKHSTRPSLSDLERQNVWWFHLILLHFIYPLKEKNENEFHWKWKHQWKWSVEWMTHSSINFNIQLKYIHLLGCYFHGWNYDKSNWYSLPIWMKTKNLWYIFFKRNHLFFASCCHFEWSEETWLLLEKTFCSFYK